MPTRTVTARRRNHQSRTTRVWNVLDCAAPGIGFGSLGLIARCEEVFGFGVLATRRGKVLVARRGKVLVARRGKVLGSGCTV